MLNFNPIACLVSLEFSKYLFGAFVVFGVMLLLRKLILKKGL